MLTVTRGVTYDRMRYALSRKAIDSTPIPVQAHQEDVDFTNGFLYAAADDLRRAIAGRQLLHIDLGELDGLRRNLCPCGVEDKKHAGQPSYAYGLGNPRTRLKERSERAANSLVICQGGVVKAKKGILPWI